MSQPPPPIGKRKIIRSTDIVINTLESILPQCSMWMVNSYARAKKLGLINVQRKLEGMASEQGCTLT